MAYSNADKQCRYRQRLSARGLVHVQGWVTPEQAEVIRRIMAKWNWGVPAEEQCGPEPETQDWRKPEPGVKTPQVTLLGCSSNSRRTGW